MLDIPLAHLPLRPSTLERCHKSGFSTAAEIASSKDTGGLANLAAELGCTVLEAHSVYREITECTTMKTKPPQSVEDVLRQQQSTGIVTFCRDIDLMLRGGVPLGELTEVCGAPGSGKTIFATQLAVDASLPEQFGGVNGGAVYLDTEGSFSPERCYALAEGLICHIRGSTLRRKLDYQWNATPQDILSNIHVFRAHTVAEVATVLQALPDFLKEFPNIKLIVVDSIAFPFRAEEADIHRTRQLAVSAAQMADLAQKHKLAVVATNQMTTQSNRGVVPALGASWAHAVTNRLILHHDEVSQNRKCQLVKSARLPPNEVAFLVTESGIRGADSPNKKPRVETDDQEM